MKSLQETHNSQLYHKCIGMVIRRRSATSMRLQCTLTHHIGAGRRIWTDTFSLATKLTTVIYTCIIRRMRAHNPLPFLFRAKIENRTRISNLPSLRNNRYTISAFIGTVLPLYETQDFSQVIGFEPMFVPCAPCENRTRTLMFKRHLLLPIKLRKRISVSPECHSLHHP